MTSAAVSGGSMGDPRHRFRPIRALRSPLRLRVYLLVVVSAALAIVAIVLAGADGSTAADVSSRAFQATTRAAAAESSAQITSIQSSLASADHIVQTGTDLGALCEVLVKGKPPYQRVNVFTTRGNLRCSSVPDTADQPDVIWQDPAFQAVLATGADQVSGPQRDAFTARPIVAFFHPLRVTGSDLGVVVASVDAPELLKPLFLQIQSDRLLLAGARAALFELAGEERLAPPDQVTGAVAHALATGEPCPVVVVEAMAWTCATVGRTGLALVVGHPADQVFVLATDPRPQQIRRAAAVLAVALVAAAVNEGLFLRRIMRVYYDVGLPRLGRIDLLNRDEIDELGRWARNSGAALAAQRQEIADHHARREDAERELLTFVAEAVETRYPFLRNHGDRVGRYARQIALRLGIGSEDVDLIEFAARVHDLGKIAIADAVYLKPGPLDPIEVAQMQLHAPRGGEMAKRMSTVPPAVVEAIRHHHEQWDGSGYPEGLIGTRIPLWSRIIAVADAYDAMTEERPYRLRALMHAEAVQVLKDGAGTQWDAAIVAAFMDVLGAGLIVGKPGPQAGLGIPDAAGL